MFYWCILGVFYDCGTWVLAVLRCWWCRQVVFLPGDSSQPVSHLLPFTLKHKHTHCYCELFFNRLWLAEGTQIRASDWTETEIRACDWIETKWLASLLSPSGTFLLGARTQTDSRFAAGSGWSTRSRESSELENTSAASLKSVFLYLCLCECVFVSYAGL